MIFVLSSFLDNIAAALIGGTIAGVVFRGKVHIGYLAAIVAASNAGGSGSVVGDTTTTMMWIDGVSPLHGARGLHRGIGGDGDLRHPGGDAAATLFADHQGRRRGRAHRLARASSSSLAILVTAIVVNVVVNVKYTALSDRFPFIGAAVWVAICSSRAAAPTALERVARAPSRARSSCCRWCSAASMMPVHKLPDASWQVALGLGFVSAVFDNIPLTALALKQGGYDWGFLAYAVGFGGSMIWFGSSAGVALTNQFPEGKSVVRVAAGRLARRARVCHRICRDARCSPMGA